MKNTEITPEERLRREKEVAFAMAAVQMDGLSPSKEYEIVTQRFINGEIELSELTQCIKEQLKNG